MTHNEILEEVIREACAEAMARGLSCCPMRAVSGTAQYSAAADALGVPVEWVLSFIDGFDGATFLFGTDRSAFDIGRTLRTEFLA